MKATTTPTHRFRGLDVICTARPQRKLWIGQFIVPQRRIHKETEFCYGSRETAIQMAHGLMRDYATMHDYEITELPHE